MFKIKKNLFKGSNVKSIAISLLINKDKQTPRKKKMSKYIIRLTLKYKCQYN